ncbi:hypothetical protein [Tropicibacter alexandrii]|uniref:hypothetical protein n=1 Tax=Tropicibacter alexandrii TaxID=2267683 RepID=UPI001008913A|nr:hypothetical protein [Tropicibacter alexandrii]
MARGSAHLTARRVCSDCHPEANDRHHDHSIFIGAVLTGVRFDSSAICFDESSFLFLRVAIFILTRARFAIREIWRESKSIFWGKSGRVSAALQAPYRDSHMRCRYIESEFTPIMTPS